MAYRFPFILSLAALGVYNAAHAAVVWRGDFETGDLSQWSKAQITSSDRARVVTSPVAEGRYALRVEVKQGDNPIGASGNRNELVYLSYEPQGTERWYRWQTMWDPTYPSVPTWQLFTQWHHSGDSGTSPVAFYVYAEEIRLIVNPESIVWRHPLVRGAWHDFVFHVKWSPNVNEGFVELWFDGQHELVRTPVATQFPGMINYLKQGLYRDNAVTEDGIIYHDGFTIGETQADVVPPAPVNVPDAGSAVPVNIPDAGSAVPAPTPNVSDAGISSASDSSLPGSGPAPVDRPQPDAAGPETPNQPQEPPGETPALPAKEALGCTAAPGMALGPVCIALYALIRRRRETRE